MKWDIHEVNRKVIRDYDGLNYYACKVFGFRGYPIKKNTILIDKTMSLAKRKETVRHEELEATLMKTKHMGYWQAHKYALKHQGGK